jgi:hypothetical protein
MVVKPKVSSPTTPMPVPVLGTSTVVSAMEGERWDPNRSLDNLKTGVMRVLAQQKRAATSPGSTAESQHSSETAPAGNLTDEGTNP